MRLSTTECTYLPTYLRFSKQISFDEITPNKYPQLQGKGPQDQIQHMKGCSQKK